MTQLPEYVVETTEGGLRVAGTRVSLDSVVHAYWNGRSPEAIIADFPSLTLEQVHGALAYYLRNQERVDAYLAHQDERWNELKNRSEQENGPLLQRLRDAKSGAITR